MTFFGPDLRNGLPIGLGSVAGFGIAPRFSPSSLFAGGVQGFWYDPSDLTTLFQDSAGTTPVTAVEQPVGLMLDKSKGLVLGTPLTISGWTNYALSPYETFTTSGSTISSAVNSSSSGYAYTNKLNMVSGQWYRMNVNVGLVSGSAPLISTGNNGTSNNVGSLSNKQLVDGSNTIYFLFNGDANDYIWIFSGAAASFSITISITPVAGNHAFQSTSASRPTLRARYNLLTYSEQLNNTTVQRNYGTVTANAGISPSGANNAFLFAGTGGTAGWDSYPTDYGSNGGVTQIFSVYAKAGTTGNIRIIIGGTYVDFNVSTGQKVSEAGVTGSITPVGNGWYRLTGTTVKTNVFHYWGIYLDNAGATSNNAFLWGTQLVNAAVFPSNTYQRVGAATDYATGAAFPPYLFSDGIDDSMLTNSVDFATVTSDGQARRNLLSNPTQFDDAVWTKSNATITQNAVVAPDGTATADAFVESTDVSSTFHSVFNSFTVTNGILYTFSVYAKYANRQWLVLTGNRDNWQAYFDIQNGVVGNRGSLTTASSITNVGDGWYRCSVTVTADSTISVAFQIASATANGTSRTPSYVGTGAIANYIWGAQLETGSTATAFQNIGTDKMLVVAGVTKSSDATAAIVAELSANWNSNAGSFVFTAPSANAPTNDINFGSRGSAAANSNQGVSLVTAAPTTKVISTLNDIAASTTLFRSNGADVGTATGTKGTGNFGNYPLYIGRRNNATAPFNGSLFSLIIAGQSYSSGQISSTESWVAAKTPLGTI